MGQFSVKFNSKWAVSSFQFKSKKKKDAVMLYEDTEICSLNLNNSKGIKVRSGLKGLLLELNNRLLESPELLLERPATEGWLAVIQIMNESAKSDLLASSMSFSDWLSHRSRSIQKVLESRSCNEKGIPSGKPFDHRISRRLSAPSE